MTKPSPPPSRTADQFVVRLPDGMRDKIAEAAKANGRSMNAEIVARLGAAEGMSPLQALDAIVLMTQDRARMELQIKHLYLELALLSHYFLECLSQFPTNAIKPSSALEKKMEEWHQLAQETFALAKPHSDPDDVLATVKNFEEITEKAQKQVPSAFSLPTSAISEEISPAAKTPVKRVTRRKQT